MGEMWGPRYQHKSETIDAKEKQEIWVDVSDPLSLQQLELAIFNNDFYQYERIDEVDTHYGDIPTGKTYRIKSVFDSEVFCKPCSEKRAKEFKEKTGLDYPYEARCSIATAIAAEYPFAIVCHECNVNFMEFIKE